jgi:hypothetical protein
MAGNALNKITKPKVKKKRAKSFAHLKLGEEPRLLNPDKLSLISALNWYNRTGATPDDRAEWVLQYMKDQKSFTKDQLDAFTSSGKKFFSTFGHLARMHNNGCILEDAQLLSLNRAIRDFLKSKHDDVLDDDGNLIVTTTKKVGVVERASTKAKFEAQTGEYAGLIDDQIDLVLNGKSPAENLFMTLRGLKCGANHAENLHGYFTTVLAEFKEVKAGKDEDLEEAYAHVGKKARKEVVKFLELVLAELGQFKVAKKVARQANKVARTKKPPKLENLIKSLKFCAKSDEYQIASVDPSKVVGANTLWVFNIKNKCLGVYQAADEKGIVVHGTSLKNATGRFRLLRKPVDFLKDFSGTKKTMEQKFNVIKTKEWVGNGRLNADTILLKVL